MTATPPTLDELLAAATAKISDAVGGPAIVTIECGEAWIAWVRTDATGLLLCRTHVRADTAIETATRDAIALLIEESKRT